MREKVKDLIYLDTPRYMSLDNLKVFYWGILIIPFFMIVMGVVSIQINGVYWKTLFPIISIAAWSFIYWMFVLMIKSKHVKKTFALRYLVNGLTGVLLSSLFMIFFASFVFSSDTSFLSVDFFLWMTAFYLLFSIIYVVLIVLCLHKGFFAAIKRKTQTKVFTMVSAFLGAVIPGAGVSGMYISRMIRFHTEINVQYVALTVLAILLVFFPSLAHINFVQYYYCKKYGITCDENGNETSPLLEPKAIEKIRKENRKCKKDEKVEHISRDCKPISTPKKIFKIFLLVLMGIASLFVLLFLVFFVKTIISKM